MENEELKQYIFQSRQAGKTDDQIRQELLSSGWAVQDIEEAMIGQIPSTKSQITNKFQSPISKILKIFVILLIAVAVIIGGYYALVNYFPQYAKYVQPYLGPVFDKIPFMGGASSPGPVLTPSTTPTPEPTKDTRIIDSDDDGLSDADEEKYKTDPNKIDTDGDGYMDGEEVQNGYDPLGPGRLLQ